MIIKSNIRKLYLLPSFIFILGCLCAVGSAATDDESEIKQNIAWAEQVFNESCPPERLPFSFVYGGRAASECAADWKRTLDDRKIDDTRRLRVLTLSDPKTGLEVRAEAIIYTDSPGVDWTLHFSNRGTQNTPIIENLKAVDVAIDAKSDRRVVLHRLNGSSAGPLDWLPCDEELLPGSRIEFAPLNGRSSMGACPFFNLDLGGQGVVTAIGWSGQWQAWLERGENGVRLKAGMQNLRLSLRPGESVRSPRILQLYWSGTDRHRPYNLFRRTMLAHIAPRVDGRPVVPPIAHMSTAFYEMDKGTEHDVLAYLAAVKGLGFEYFWVDAYYGKDDFPTVGNYVFPLLRGFNQTRFPRGMKPIGDAVRREGMKFLMWFEPERICPGTLIAQEHPEWVVLPKEGRWGMFNLAVPEAREYITRYLNESIKEYGIDCLRIDNAVVYTPLWQALDEASPDRVGISEIRYVEGLYRLWDDVLAANPGLFIDNCASGGQRIDLGTCSRSIPLWRTDSTIDPLLKGDFQQAAINNQVMTAGLSRYLPYHTSGQMGAAPYLFRSGFNAGISFSEDVRPADYPRELLKKAIGEGKRIRKYYAGNFYPLAEVTTSAEDWCVMQYHRPEKSDGMVMALRRHACPRKTYALDLREIDPSGDYEVTFSHDYDPTAAVRMSGSQLRRLEIEIPDSPGSLVVEYRKSGKP